MKNFFPPIERLLSSYIHGMLICGKRRPVKGPFEDDLSSISIRPLQRVKCIKNVYWVGTIHVHIFYISHDAKQQQQKQKKNGKRTMPKMFTNELK